jgi:hypothetical protein
MMRTKGNTAAAVICLFVGLCATFANAQSDAHAKLTAMTRAQELHQLFVAEANPYKRVEYVKELPNVLKRFGAKGSEQWVDDFLGSALGDSKTEVVVTAIRHVGHLQKPQFIDRMVDLYATVGQSALSLSRGPIRCEIIKVLKQYPDDARVSALLAHVITDQMTDPSVHEVRLAVGVMGQSGNRDFVSPLRSFSGIIKDKKDSLEAKVNDATLSDEKKSSYNYLLSMYASLLGQAEKSIQTLVNSQGGAR